MKKRLQKNNSKGFSLMEAMLSVFLVSFGIIAILPLLSAGLREAFGSRDQMIAALLAQEGIEIMRNIRDNDFAKGVDFLDSIKEPSFEDNRVCSVEYGGGNCDDGKTRKIYLSGSGGFYDHNAGGTPTKFSRQIKVDNIAAGRAKKVTCMVVWGTDYFPSNTTGCKLDPAGNKGCVYSQVELTDWGS